MLHFKSDREILPIFDHINHGDLYAPVDKPVHGDRNDINTELIYKYSLIEDQGKPVIENHEQPK